MLAYMSLWLGRDLQSCGRGIRCQVGEVDGGAPAHVVQELDINLLQEVLERDGHRLLHSSDGRASNARSSEPTDRGWGRGHTSRPSRRSRYHCQKSNSDKVSVTIPARCRQLLATYIIRVRPAAKHAICEPVTGLTKLEDLPAICKNSPPVPGCRGGLGVAPAALCIGAGDCMASLLEARVGVRASLTPPRMIISWPADAFGLGCAAEPRAGESRRCDLALVSSGSGVASACEGRLCRCPTDTGGVRWRRGPPGIAVTIQSQQVESV